MNTDLKNNNNDSLLEEKSKYHYEKQMAEQNEYQDKVTQYINQKKENNIKKNYNPKIVNLYKNGIIVINNEEYKLKDFFIVYSSILNNYQLKCINKEFNNNIIEYNRAVRFIDTTAFINLINNSDVKDNKIIIEEYETLKNIVSNWDGYIHSEVLKTDSILNKKMTSYDI